MSKRSDRQKAYYDQSALWDRELTKQEIERSDLVKKMIPEDVKTLLDAGCGSGAISNYLPDHLDITGVDFSKEALKHFKRRKMVLGLEKLPFPNGSFDLVICSDVLEHILPDVFGQVVAEIKRVSKKYVLVISPHAENLELGKIRCFKCGAIFHMNRHLRSLNLQDIKDLFSDSLYLDTFTFFGDPWRSEPRLLPMIRQICGGKLSGWQNAVCPLCNSVQKEESTPLFDTTRIENWLREFTPRDEDCIRHSEVAALFSKKKPTVKVDFHSLPALLIKNATSQLESPSIVLRHRYDLLVGNALYVRETTIYNPELPHVLKNSNMDWGDIVHLDGKTVRFYENVGGKDCHAVIIFPRLERNPDAIYVEYKDITSGSVLFQVYNMDKGYTTLGEIVGENDGQWKTKRFDFPSHIQTSEEGITCRFVTREECHHLHPIPIARIYSHGNQDEGSAALPLMRVEEDENMWLVPKTGSTTDKRWIIQFPHDVSPGLVYLITTGQEYYFLGSVSPEIMIPQWLYSEQRVVLEEAQCFCGTLDVLRNYIAKLDDISDQRRKKIGELDAKIGQLEGIRQSLAMDRENLEVRVKELEGEKHILTAEKEDLLTMVLQLKDVKESLDKEKAALSLHLSKAQEELEKTMSVVGVKQYIRIIDKIKGKKQS